MTFLVVELQYQKKREDVGEFRTIHSTGLMVNGIKIMTIVFHQVSRVPTQSFKQILYTR